MQFAKDHAPADFTIHSCDASGVMVNDQLWTESFILLPEKIIQPWQGIHSALASHHFRIMIAKRPELVILGTGADLQRPCAEVYGALLSQGIGFEVMSTAAACRTYNLLAQDGRRIAGGMILPA